MWSEQRHSPHPSSSAKADDPVIADGSVNYLTRGEYWVPRMRGA
jgi:hypothetical protein